MIQLAQNMFWMSVFRNLSPNPFNRSNNGLNEKGTGITIMNKLKIVYELNVIRKD